MNLSNLPWWGWVLCGLGVLALWSRVKPDIEDPRPEDEDDGGTSLSGFLFFLGAGFILVGIVRLMIRVWGQ